jgi:hypothetical protein
MPAVGLLDAAGSLNLGDLYSYLSENYCKEDIYLKEDVFEPDIK